MTDRNTPDLYSTQLLKRRWLSNRAFELELTKPPGFHFLPGQRIRFIHESIEREYFPISSPGNHTISICVGLKEGGMFTPVLASARIAERFKFTGPHGHFTLQSRERPVIFVATGTGIAPFVSMGRSGIEGFTFDDSTHNCPFDA